MASAPTSLSLEDGAVMGTLATNLEIFSGNEYQVLLLQQTSAWGLGPMFRRRGVEADDYLVVVFDLAKRAAVAHVGDQGLLEGFQTGGRDTRLTTDEMDLLSAAKQTMQ